MGGDTGVRKIREDKKARNISVIALTAPTMKGDREQIIAAGCEDCIPKPVDSEEVIKKVDKWIRKSREK